MGNVRQQVNKTSNGMSVNQVDKAGDNIVVIIRRLDGSQFSNDMASDSRGNNDKTGNDKVTNDKVGDSQVNDDEAGVSRVTNNKGDDSLVDNGKRVTPLHRLAVTNE